MMPVPCASTSTLRSLLPSLSSLSLSAPARSFSASTIQYEKKAKAKARLKKKKNIEKRIHAKEALERTRPHPIRGYFDQSVWEGSLLKSILVDRSSLENPSSTGEEAQLLNFGLSSEDGDLLFNKMPTVNAANLHQRNTSKDMETGTFINPYPAASATSNSSGRFQAADWQALESNNAEALRRIVDLRNANARGIRAENTKRIVDAFGKGEGSGRSEVQAALANMQIHTLSSILAEQPKDFVAKRSLTAYVMQRASTLKYLKRTSLDRYVQCLKDIGVEQRAVEGEIVLKNEVFKSLKEVEAPKQELQEGGKRKEQQERRLLKTRAKGTLLLPPAGESGTEDGARSSEQSTIA